MAFLSVRGHSFEILAALVLCSVRLLAGVPANTREVLDEYQVKALFLYNFAKFFEWPRELLEESFCIGTIGQDPFSGALEQIVQKHATSGRSFRVEHYRTAAEARKCHIVFIPASDFKRIRAALDGLAGTNALTVGESAGFCESGGVVNFTLVEGTVRFEINPAAAARAGLRVSSKLLNLARIAREQP